MLVVFCLVANPRHQAPKSATHRLGWLWNSNAYAIRGHRKILSSTERTLMEINELPRGRDAAILHRITKCARPVTLVRESAPFMRLCDALPEANAPPRSPEGARSPPWALYRNCYGSMNRGALCHSLPQSSAMSRAPVATRITGRRRGASAPVFSACNLHIRGRDLRFAKPASGSASYAAAPWQVTARSAKTAVQGPVRGPAATLLRGKGSRL